MLGAVAALLVAGCTDARQSAGQTLREIGPQPLRLEAARAYKNLFVAPNARYFLVSPDASPPAFQRFRPLQVRAYPDGFALVLRDQPTVEEGLYVVPLGMDRAPHAAASTRFERIDDGIYWYWFAR